ncbi:putative uncharacterized protein [Ruminococcus sp. CAG:579]|jgi:hypothetical protein|nr:putative uncharacterized protein [Ruminococcus sp. CAG:579]
MAKAKNKVIAGDYEGSPVILFFGGSTGIKFNKEQIMLNSKNVEKYEVITDEQRKSAASGVARGIVGGALLGPVGLLAGGLSAKSKGIYQVAVQFNEGKRSLLEIDEKIYKALVKNCF